MDGMRESKSVSLTSDRYVPRCGVPEFQKQQVQAFRRNFCTLLAGPPMFAAKAIPSLP